MAAVKRYVRGEDHPQAKLSEARVKLIRRSTETLRDIGSRFGVIVGHVWRVKNGVNWSHVVSP
jgi:hypothetical protein